MRWPRILSDVVWVIRKFQPDVIIARFPGDERAGHGHHQASNLLAVEAYKAAADPNMFPEQLKLGVQTWQAKRLLWNTFNFGGTNTTDSTQMMLIRTDSLGHSGCHEQDSHPNIDTTNFITQSLTFTQTNGITENLVVSNSLTWNVSAEDACLYIQVKENETDDVEVFPNPAVNKLAISSMQFAIKTIAIYNLLGEEVLAVALQIANCKLQTEADVSQLPSGIYFLRINTSSSSITKKIIIQKN